RLLKLVPEEARTFACAEENGMSLQQVGFCNFLKPFARLPDIDGSLELFDEGIRFIPNRSCVDSLQPLQVCKLEPRPQHRLGINWKIVRHFGTPGRTPPMTASRYRMAPSADMACRHRSMRHRRYPDAPMEYSPQIPARTSRR